MNGGVPWKPGAIGGRMGATVVLLAGLAAMAGPVHFPSILRAPLGYLLVGVIPGWLLARSLLRSEGSTPEETAMLSLALSIPLAIVGRSLAFTLVVPGSVFVGLWAGVCSVWAMSLRPRVQAQRADSAAWLIAGALALLVALPAGLNPVMRVSGDAMVHSQIVHEIRLRGIPPQDPSFAGMPLAYMWQFHVWVAALTEATGLTPFGVFPWVSGAMMAALAFGAYRVASVFWPARLYRLLAPLVMALGMNALGWLPVVISPFVGRDRGLDEVSRQVSAIVIHPNVVHVCSSLIYESYFILCSLLFKFFCANALATGITLVVVTFVLVAVELHEGGKGRLVAIAIAAASAAVTHPLVGIPAGVALLVGVSLVATRIEERGAAFRSALAIGTGLAGGAAVTWFMLRAAIQGGEPTRFELVTANLPPLVQGLGVLVLFALWGWFAVLRRSRALALLGLGFALASLVFATVLNLPLLGEAYLVYTAYLGVALFAAGGVGAAATALGRRFGAAPAWAVAALVFLPNAMLLANGFARQDEAWGLAGYPETRDEVAAFDFVRDSTPLHAIVIDAQYFSSSSVSAYSGRRGLFGGMRQAKLVGYPRDVMKERERAVANLLLEPGLSATTLQVLRGLHAPVFVVARRTPPRDLITALPPDPPVDAVAKLDSLGKTFQPLFRTPTIVVFRLVRKEASASNSRVPSGSQTVADLLEHAAGRAVVPAGHAVPFERVHHRHGHMQNLQSAADPRTRRVTAESCSTS